MWKYFLIIAASYLELAGNQKINEDANDTGTDDLVGQTLIYLGKVAYALANGQEPPKAPPQLQ